MPQGGWTSDDGNYLYYGMYGGSYAHWYEDWETSETYSNTPVKYRVLSNDNANNNMLIDSDTILFEDAFNDADNQMYASSDIRAYLKDAKVLTGDRASTTTDLFTAKELAQIKETSLPAAEKYDTTTVSHDHGSFAYTYFEDASENNKAFLLTAHEIETYYYINTALSEYDPTNASKFHIGMEEVSSSWGLDYVDTSYWTRSAFDLDNSNNKNVGRVLSGKLPDGQWASKNMIGVAPAANLDTSNILFTTAQTFDKTADLTAVTDTTNKEWVPTLKDTALGVTLDTGTLSGGTVTVPYAATGDDATQVSVMLTSGDIDDSNTEILYYGKLGNAADSQGTFTLPADLPSGYKAYAMTEDINSDQDISSSDIGSITDYASEPVEFTIAAQEATVKFYVDGTEDANKAQTVELGQKATDPTDQFTKEGYKLDGWYTTPECTGDKYDFDTAVNEDIDLYAKWVPAVYSITYKGMDGATVSGNPESYTIESDTITLNSPTKTGYAFSGWTTDAVTEPTKDLKIEQGSTGNKTFTANWVIYTYTVTFDDGSDTTKVPVDYGHKVTKPDNPAKDGYKFGGWFTDKACTTAWDFDKDTVTKDVTLYAKWTKTDADNGGADADKNDSDSSSKTGDDTNVLGMLALLILAGGTAGTVFIRRRHS